VESPKIEVIKPDYYFEQILANEKYFIENQVKFRENEFILPFVFSNFTLLFKKNKLTESRCFLEFISKIWKIDDFNNQPIQILTHETSYLAVLNQESMEKLMKKQKCFSL
jgi:hypothetical protein